MALLTAAVAELASAEGAALTRARHEDAVRRAIDANIDADRILIDTTGKSPRSRDSLPLLEGTLRAVQASAPLPPPPQAYQKEFSRYELELRADDHGG